MPNNYWTEARCRANAENNLNDLKEIGKHGLPDIYVGKYRDWSYDFWPNLPWDGAMHTVAKMIVDHPDFKETLDAFTEKVGRNDLRWSLQQVAATDDLDKINQSAAVWEGVDD